MDLINLAPGMRKMLEAFGFKPDDLISLLQNIGNGIKGIRDELTAMNARLDAIEQNQKGTQNGRSDQSADDRTEPEFELRAGEPGSGSESANG